MKRTAAAIAAFVVAALVLTGCGTSPDGSAKVEPINLSDKAVVSALCGDKAVEVYNAVLPATEAKAESGKRNALKDWGIANPQDEATVQALATDLKTRSETECQDPTKEPVEEDSSTSDDSTATETADQGNTKVGTKGADGKVIVLPAYNGNGTPVSVDSTDDPATPPLLDFGQRYEANTLSWAGLVERVGDQQWYIDEVNARSKQTGFDWNDVLKFAEANKVVDGKVQGVNALTIQVFGYTKKEMSVAEARAKVAEYITPEVEAEIGVSVDDLHVQYIQGGFINTLKSGTTDNPGMANYFSREKMVRVNLTPIIFNKKGEAIRLDTSRGAGIFIDCANLHWVPELVWECVGKGCNPPPPPPPPEEKCPPGTTGTPPNCLQPKDPKKTTQNDGWTKKGPGKKTDGKESKKQKKKGDTRGNVTDDKVGKKTKSGDTTPEPKKKVKAPDTKKDGDNRKDDVVDEKVTNQDDGGTNGDTCITDPDTGESQCS